MREAKNENPGLIGFSLLKLDLLVDLVLELACLLEVLVLHVSDEHHDQGRVEGDPLKGVVTDPRELDFLGLIEKLEHRGLQ
jgi:hypothetical protein